MIVISTYITNHMHQINETTYILQRFDNTDSLQVCRADMKLLDGRRVWRLGNHLGFLLLLQQPLFCYLCIVLRVFQCCRLNIANKTPSILIIAKPSLASLLLIWKPYRYTVACWTTAPH